MIMLSTGNEQNKTRSGTVKRIKLSSLFIQFDFLPE